MLVQNFGGQTRCILGDVQMANWPFWGRFCFIREKSYCYSESFTFSVKMPKI